MATVLLVYLWNQKKRVFGKNKFIVTMYSHYIFCRAVDLPNLIKTVAHLRVKYLTSILGRASGKYW